MVSGFLRLEGNHWLCRWKKEAIKKYIQNQLQEDQPADQMSIKEYYDPFTGEAYPQRNSDKKNPFTDRKKT